MQLKPNHNTKDFSIVEVSNLILRIYKHKLSKIDKWNRIETRDRPIPK